LEILKLDVKDARWLSLIEKDPAATIFHHPAWMEVLSECYGYHPFILAVVDKERQISAGIPVAEITNHLAPRRWVSLPFSDYCTPLYRDEESLRHLASALVEQQHTNNCHRVEVRTALPGQPDIGVQSHFVLHTVPLEADSAIVAKRATRQQMQNVRTAEKNEIRIVRGTSLAEVGKFFRLHSLSRRRHGVPVQPWNYFKLLTRFILEKNLGFVLLAYKDNFCISAGLFLHWQRTLTYKYSATDEAYQNLRPNHLVTWTAMKWGCKNGFAIFDFGRADLDDEGLRAYKCRWGAEEAPLSYSHIPSTPESKISGESTLNNLLKKVIRRSPVWLCQFIGGILYRYVG
jgi:CelD/BcsL family acetyltransferase involved in cellulose biosynthesis